MTSERTLFSTHAAAGLSNLIQYNRSSLNEHLVSVGYADAARRLRASYKAEPWDDVMLLPFMFLWRQAIEIELKRNIRGLATLRRRNGDKNPRLDLKAMDDRLRNPRKVGHNLRKLVRELSEHIAALALQEIPGEVSETLELLAALDNGGTAFRYAGALEAPSADIDFQAIAESLDATFRLLEVIIDAATHGEGI